MDEIAAVVGEAFRVSCSFIGSSGRHGSHVVMRFEALVGP